MGLFQLRLQAFLLRPRRTLHPGVPVLAAGEATVLANGCGCVPRKLF